MGRMRRRRRVREGRGEDGKAVALASHQRARDTLRVMTRVLKINAQVAPALMMRAAPLRLSVTSEDERRALARSIDILGTDKGLNGGFRCWGAF